MQVTNKIMLATLSFKILSSESRKLHFLRFLLRKLLVSLGTQDLKNLVEEKLRKVVFRKQEILATNSYTCLKKVQ